MASSKRDLGYWRLGNKQDSVILASLLHPSVSQLAQGGLAPLLHTSCHDTLPPAGPEEIEPQKQEHRWTFLFLLLWVYVYALCVQMCVWESHVCLQMCICAVAHGRRPEVSIGCVLPLFSTLNFETELTWAWCSHICPVSSREMTITHTHTHTTPTRTTDVYSCTLYLT